MKKALRITLGILLAIPVSPFLIGLAIVALLASTVDFVITGEFRFPPERP
jgi:hypothetical protein